jgi:hypothetical protein
LLSIIEPIETFVLQSGAALYGQESVPLRIQTYYDPNCASIETTAFVYENRHLRYAPGLFIYG